MAWEITGDAERFLTLAGAFLRARPVENTVLLTIADSERLRPSPGALFGWNDQGGAFLRTPPRPPVLSEMPAPTVRGLAVLLSADELPGVIGPDAVAREFAAAWEEHTGGTARALDGQRLYRLATLMPPEPHPAGAARIATAADRELLLGWMSAFLHDVRDPHTDPETFVADRLSYGGFLVWEDAGRPVAMAALTRPNSGVVRLQAVYTPPRERGHGYAGALTTAISRAAHEAGAREVVLFTDLFNPTSNALYQRLGFVPLGDRTIMEFAA